MNGKLKQVIVAAGSRIPEFAVFGLVLLAGFLVLAFIGVTDTPDLDTNTTTNQTDLNVSKYYNHSQKTCEKPGVNLSNASQLQACVQNKTMT